MDQPICAIFMSGMIPSLPFEHWRDSCLISSSKVRPSRGGAALDLAMALLADVPVVGFVTRFIPCPFCPVISLYLTLGEGGPAAFAERREHHHEL